MPLLRDGQFISNDPWTLVNDDQLVSSDRDYAILSFQRFLQLAQDGESLPDGVSIAPADNANLLAPYVDRLSLICLEFPVFTDGRGYSHARLLRKRYGYEAELRAVGDIRADQFLFLQRLGVNAFDCTSTPEPELVQKLVSRFEYNYQPSYPLPNGVELNY